MSYILKNLIFILLGLAGFSLAFFIYCKKTKKQPLICPMRFDCNTVIQSQYSKFFGLPVEMMGIFFYGFIVVIHVFFIFQPVFLGYSFIIFLVSLTAFTFSLYLAAIQIFTIHEWCIWCISSTFISAAIFLLSIYMYNIDILLIN